ncbi:MAG: O-antigen ligase family protein [Lentisphaeria bacterium]|nr:O-antigen ligase family protein [Lentisphaeria bacterium]
MLKGKFAWIAEAAAGLILFLLPLKFGTLVAIPNLTMIYWSDPVSLFIGAWPAPVFPVVSGIFLMLSLLFVPGEIFPGRAGKFAGLWLLLGLAALPGGIAKETPPDAFAYFVSYILSTGAFLLGFVRVVNHNRNVIGVFYGLFTFSFLISLAIGLNQYFSGYQDTIDQIQSKNMGEVNASILFKLRQMRVAGGFSACNAFAGYLVLGMPIALAWLWKMGKRFSPEKVSRVVFTVPVFLVSVFLLVKTGSRGGILSLLAAVFVLFLASDMPRKWRWCLFSLIPLGIAGMTALVMLGRGGKSILFRLDYFQGAFRMMADSPLYGVGWGGFQRQFMKMKWIYDAEAPASPHNFPLSIGAQAGVAGFLIACVILVFSIYFLYRYLFRSKLTENLHDNRIVFAGSLAGIAGFTVHCLQDILFESPGAIVTCAAVVILTLIEIEPQDEKSVFERKYPALHYVFLVMVLVYGFSGLYCGWKVLSFDYSLAALNDMTDFRMIPPEEYAKINPAEVQSSFETVMNKNPSSPYPYMTMSDFCRARGDFAASKLFTLKALELDPSSSALHMRLYRVERSEGNLSAAKEYLNKAISLFPMNPKYREELKTLEK